MDFKLDENLPVALADLLVRAGHDAMTVQQQALVLSVSEIHASILAC